MILLAALVSSCRLRSKRFAFEMAEVLLNEQRKADHLRDGACVGRNAGELAVSDQLGGLVGALGGRCEDVGELDAGGFKVLT